VRREEYPEEVYLEEFEYGFAVLRDVLTPDTDAPPPDSNVFIRACRARQPDTEFVYCGRLQP
jgi:hypothetical protein